MRVPRCRIKKDSGEGVEGRKKKGRKKGGGDRREKERKEGRKEGSSSSRDILRHLEVFQRAEPWQDGTGV